VSWASPAQILSACLLVLVSTFCLCWFERSRRKTIREILPELQGTDPAVVREVSRLLVSRRWKRETASPPRLEVVRPPLDQLLGDLAQLQPERDAGDHREPGAARG
jgi:hypothetical protein